MDDEITRVIRALVREEVQAALKKRDTQSGKEKPFDPLRMYSVKSAAEILDTSQDYVLNRIHDGSIPHHVDLGGTRAKFRVRAEDLRKFIDSRTVN